MCMTSFRKLSGVDRFRTNFDNGMLSNSYNIPALQGGQFNVDYEYWHKNPVGLYLWKLDE